jgi:hypothetical protein
MRCKNVMVATRVYSWTDWERQKTRGYVMWMVAFWDENSPKEIWSLLSPDTWY